MDLSTIGRRNLLIGAASVAVALPMQRVAAQATPDATATLTAGSWFDQVKMQHQAIADQLTLILSNDAVGFGALQQQLKRLSYLLSAHAVAEENVLYPALTRKGLEVGAADLYLEQQWQKVWNADIDLISAVMSGLTPDVKERLTRLQEVILVHANEHEVKELYPKLWAKSTSAENAELSVMFARSFMTVSPVS